MCIMDCGVYTYIFSCPYIKVKEFVVPQPPASAKLDDTELEDALELMGNISSSEGDSYFNKKMRFLYALELTGIAMRKQMTGK